MIISADQLNINMNRKFIYFINPISGTGKKILLLEIIKKETELKNIPFEMKKII